MDEARKRISMSLLFDRDEIEKAVRIIKSLISQKHIAKAQDSEAESRIDYLADILGLSKREVISVGRQQRYICLFTGCRWLGTKVANTPRTFCKTWTIYPQPYSWRIFANIMQATEWQCSKQRDQYIQRKRYSDTTLFPHCQGLYPQKRGCGS